MSLTRDLTRPLTRDLTRPADGSPYERFRNITAFVPGTPTYIVIPDVVLAGDFEIKVKLSPSAGSTRIFLNNPSTNAFYLAAQSATSNLITRHASTSYNGTVAMTLGEVNSIRVKREGISLKSWVNDSLGTDVTVTTSTQTIGVVGASQGFSGGFPGEIFDLEIYDNGSLARRYRLDEDWSSTSTAIDSSGNEQHGTATNLATTERFGLNINTAPHQWENADKSTIIPLAY